MKICKECKWLDWHMIMTLSKCMQPDGDLDPLTGNLRGEFADISRSFGPCGKDGILFEAKPRRRTIWARLVSLTAPSGP